MSSVSVHTVVQRRKPKERQMSNLWCVSAFICLIIFFYFGRYCPGGPDSDFEYSTQSYTGYEVRHHYVPKQRQPF